MIKESPYGQIEMCHTSSIEDIGTKTSSPITDTSIDFISVKINSHNYPQNVIYKIDIKDYKERLRFRKLNEKFSKFF